MKHLASVLLATLVILPLLPALALLGEALGDGSILANAWLDFDSRQARLFLRSLQVASTSACLALVWGLTTAYTITRLRGPLSSLLEVASYLPILLPNIVLVIGWMQTFGPGGTATRCLEWLTGVQNVPFDLCTPWGAGFVLSLCYFPYLTIACAQGYRAVDQRGLLAAGLVASGPRRVWSIWRPLMTPYAVTGILLVFLLSFADYGVPSALMVNVYPVEVFARLSSFRDPQEAMALTFLPFSLAMLLCILRHACFRTAPYTATCARKATAAAPSTCVVLLAIAVVFASSVGPLFSLAISAGGPATYVRALKTAGSQILNSLEAAAWGTLLMTSGALVFAFCYRAAGRISRSVAEATLLSLLLIPGSAVGMGMLLLKNTAVLSGLPMHVWQVSLAAASRFMAFPSLLLAFAVMALNPRVFQAAAVSGAGSFRIATRMYLPLLLPTILVASVLSFLLTLTELSAAVLVYPPGGMTLPVRLASLLHFGEESTVAALCVMISGFALGLLLFIQLLVGRPLHIKFHGEYHD